MSQCYKFVTRTIFIILMPIKNGLRIIKNDYIGGSREVNIMIWWQRLAHISVKNNFQWLKMNLSRQNIKKIRFISINFL